MFSRHVALPIWFSWCSLTTRLYRGTFRIAVLCATLRDPPFQRSDVLTTDDFRHPRQFLCLFAQPLQLVSTNFVGRISRLHVCFLQQVERCALPVRVFGPNIQKTAVNLRNLVDRKSTSLNSS